MNFPGALKQGKLSMIWACAEKEEQKQRAKAKNEIFKVFMDGYFVINCDLTDNRPLSFLVFPKQAPLFSNYRT
jgi:hypothetical protein